MPGKLPYFPFYVDDFAASSAVEAMTTEQVGAYILLLCKAWGQTPPASIPSDDAILARYARLDLKRWLEIKSGVLNAFNHHKDGRFHQPRMLAEYRKIAQSIAKRENAGRVAARKRWENHTVANANTLPTQCVSGYGSIPSLETYSEEEKQKPDAIANAFALFWAAYPRKENEKQALKTWMKLAPGDGLIATIMDAIALQTQSGKAPKYFASASRWLADELWKDQPIDTAETQKLPPADDGLTDEERRGLDLLRGKKCQP